MKILGIDPGFGTMGWAIIEHHLKIVEFGSVETSSTKELDEKLLDIHNAITKIIKKYKPDCVAIERLFFARNTKTAIDVAKCIGTILLTTRLSGLRAYEYNPSQVKQAITGYGRATKHQMQRMIMRIFKTSDLPKPDDAADALAVAACHFFHSSKLKGKCYYYNT